MAKNAMVAVLLFAMFGLLVAHFQSNLLQSTRKNDTGDEDIDEDIKVLCCDNCGSCTEADTDIAKCECRDIVPKCGVGCENCVEAAYEILPPRYMCMSMNATACHTRCSVI